VSPCPTKGTILHTSPFAAISFGERDGRRHAPSLVELDARSRSPASMAGCTPNIVQDLWDKVDHAVLAGGDLLPDARLVRRYLEADEGRAIVPARRSTECRKVAAGAGHDPGDEGHADHPSAS
jgi:2-dehydropantoate 2-reductase